jgi:hypothetical protein
MTRTVIENAQQFLTMVREDRVYHICNIEQLLERHPPATVIGFLRSLQRDCRRDLKILIRRDKTHPRINALIVMNFRLRMAINTIKNAIEADPAREVA